MEAFQDLFAGPWGPALIFTARMTDVAMATVRMMLSVRGARAASGLIGFFEALIWVFAVGAAIQNLHSPLHLFGYASGFAAGSVTGVWIEERLAFGLATVRIISTHAGVEMAEALRELGFGVTEFAGQGKEGPVEVVYTVTQRRRIRDVVAEVGRWDPEAFVTVENPQAIERGWLFQKRRK